MCALACLLLSGGCGQSSLPPPRGVLLITIDTLRADQLGPYGARQTRTPNIDELAASGVVFDNCIATAPWTLPSMGSMFTGKYPHAHGAVGGSHNLLADRHRTLAEVAKEAGYRTAAFVAAEYTRSEFGLDQGFDLYDDDFAGPSRPAADYQGHILDWLEGQREENFFLWVHYFTPHTPYRPSPRFDRLYYDGEERAPDNSSMADLWASLERLPPQQREGYQWLRGVTDIEYPIAQYRALVTESDYYVGELLQALRRLHRWEDTLVILTADHGEHLGEHGLFFLHLELYQEVLRVPLIISYPAESLGGRRVDSLVQGIDIYATVLDYLDHPGPTFHAHSLRPLMQGEGGAIRDFALSEWGGGPNYMKRAMQEGRWKLIFKREREDIEYELYDLRGDPAELEDLAAEHPDVVARLAQRLGPLRELVVMGDAPERELDEETLRRLRALGYVR